MVNQHQKSGLHRLILVALPLALLITWLFPQAVSAHAILLRSDPARDSVLSTSPSQIRMWFSEDLNPTFSAAYIVNAANNAANVQKDIKMHVDKGDAHVSAIDTREMDVSLKPDLPSAVYVVLYRTQSAQDGHILYGSFLFTIASANGTVPTFTGTLPLQGTFGGRGNSNGQLDGPTFFSFIMITLVDLGAIFWVGAQLWCIFVLSDLQSEDQGQQEIIHQMEQRFNRHFSWPALLLILSANIGVLIGQALTLTSGQWGPALAPSLLISMVARGQFGTYWIMREVVTLVALIVSLCLLMIKQASSWAISAIAWANFALGMALLSALTLSGHAAATSSNIVVYAVGADFLHLLAAASLGWWYALSCGSLSSSFKEQILATPSKIVIDGTAVLLSVGDYRCCANGSEWSIQRSDSSSFVGPAHYHGLWLCSHRESSVGECYATHQRHPCSHLPPVPSQRPQYLSKSHGVSRPCRGRRANTSGINSGSADNRSKKTHRAADTETKHRFTLGTGLGYSGAPVHGTTSCLFWDAPANDPKPDRNTACIL